jgi:hypothetical protein
MGMSPEVDTGPVEHIGVIATQALRSLERRSFFVFWTRGVNHSALHDALNELLPLVCDLDPKGLTEDAFAELTHKLTLLIEALERHFAENAHPDDVAECQFLGSSLARLKDARTWISQGLSPNQAKRPAESARRLAAEERANEVWADLFA